MNYVVSIGPHRRTVSVNADGVTIDGRPVTASAVRAGESPLVSLVLDGHQTSSYARSSLLPQCISEQGDASRAYSRSVTVKLQAICGPGRILPYFEREVGCTPVFRVGCQGEPQ